MSNSTQKVEKDVNQEAEQNDSGDKKQEGRIISLSYILRIAVFLLAILSAITTTQGLHTALLPENPIISGILSAAIQGSLLALNFMVPKCFRQMTNRKNKSSNSRKRSKTLFGLVVFLWICFWLASGFFSVVFYTNEGYKLSHNIDAEAMLVDKYFTEREIVNSEVQKEIIILQSNFLNQFVIIQNAAPAAIQNLHSSSDENNSMEWAAFCGAEYQIYNDALNTPGAKNWDPAYVGKRRFDTQSKTNSTTGNENTADFNTSAGVSLFISQYVDSLGAQIMTDTLNQLKNYDVSKLLIDEERENAIEVIDYSIKEIKALKGERIEQDSEGTQSTNNALNSGDSEENPNSIAYLKKQITEAEEEGTTQYEQREQYDKSDAEYWRNVYQIGVKGVYEQVISEAEAHYQSLINTLESYKNILNSIQYSSRYYLAELEGQVTNIDTFSYTTEAKETGNQQNISDTETTDENSVGNTTETAIEIFSNLEASLVSEAKEEQETNNAENASETGDQSDDINSALKKMGRILNKLNLLTRASALISDVTNSSTIYTVFTDPEKKEDDAGSGEAEGNVDFYQAWSEAINNLMKANDCLQLSNAISIEDSSNSDSSNENTDSDIMIDGSYNKVYDNIQTLAGKMEWLKHNYLADLNPIQKALNYMNVEIYPYTFISRIAWAAGMLQDLFGLLLGFIVTSEKSKKNKKSVESQKS